MRVTSTKAFFAIYSFLFFFLAMVLTFYSSTLKAIDGVIVVQKDQVLLHIERTENKMCVSQDSQLQQLVDSASNIVILMPAKAAGSTLKYFATRCSGESFEKLTDNFLNYKNETNYLTTSYELPPVISSHLYSDEPLKDLFKHASEDTLFIYSHRKETSRLMSGIKQAIRNFCDGIQDGSDFLLENTRDRCVISEHELIRRVIKNKESEVRFGTERILTCTTYESIKMNLPNLLFMDYEVADRVQAVIARKYCPEEVAVRTNVGDDGKGKKCYVNLSEHNAGANVTVTLDDWLRVKRSHIEISLKMKEHITCQAITRRLENALDTCESHVIKVDDDWIGAV